MLASSATSAGRGGVASPTADHAHQESPGLHRAFWLIAKYAWSSRTLASRESQWRCYTAFCAEEGRAALPANEPTTLAYIGWLAEMREQGRRAVSPQSLPQYLSCIRNMHAALTGSHPPEMPSVTVACRAYARWYAETIPEGAQRPRRHGVPATLVLAVWAHGMRTDDLAELRDAAFVVLSYVLGLRESSAASLLAADVVASSDVFSARLCVLKGKAARGAPPAVYRRISLALPSACDLAVRWAARRPTHCRFFALAIEPPAWSSGSLTSALRRSCARLPPGLPESNTHYSSHSLRIGAHTEQVLLGVPVEVRKARFGWAPASPMEAVYFDRSMCLSSASSWFFGSPCGE
jgi:hypothetical protein